MDEIVDLAIAASIDVAAQKTAKKHRIVRIVKALGGILFVFAVTTLIAITFIFS